MCSNGLYTFIVGSQREDRGLLTDLRAGVQRSQCPKILGLADIPYQAKRHHHRRNLRNWTVKERQTKKNGGVHVLMIDRPAPQPSESPYRAARQILVSLQTRSSSLAIPFQSLELQWSIDHHST